MRKFNFKKDEINFGVNQNNVIFKYCKQRKNHIKLNNMETQKFLTDKELKAELGVKTKQDMMLLASEEGYNWCPQKAGWTKEPIKVEATVVPITKEVKTKKVVKTPIEKLPKTDKQKDSKPTTTIKASKFTEAYVKELVADKKLVVIKSNLPIVEAELVILPKTSKECFKFKDSAGKCYSWYPSLVSRFAKVL
jgi:hypothetical protein